MARHDLRFDGFVLDPVDRQLRRNGVRIALNPRYFDALSLLVREHGSLISKQRFLDEVWRGVPVTDEALTQCIRTLRRQLGDNATAPRFIETVPKHGYRFVATVARDDDAPAPASAPPPTLHSFLQIGGAGTLGAGAAGMFGGLCYGFAGTLQGGIGEASALLVMMGITLLLALLGGAGVSFGAALPRLLGLRAGYAPIVGGAGGGLLVGGVVRLLGSDAFALLLGRSPGDFTGAVEGAALGAAVGIGLWRARGRHDVQPVGEAAAIGLVAGMLIAAAGGHLMGGSLDLLARSFPESHLRLDAIGALFGERGFGRLSALATAGMEGALFCGCIVAATLLAGRRTAPAA